MFRYFGFPRLLPLNLTVSLTYRCNSSCKTCNIYKKKVSEFTLAEFEKTFQSIGNAPFWLTMSGGEPFLRKDIVDICKSAYENCRPKIINIPTNGILCDIIPNKVLQIAKNSPDAQIIVNLSIDEIGERHDEIRNVKKNFIRVTETFNRLKKLSLPNLTVVIHTVISMYNVKNFQKVYEELNKLKPDSYITEIAEERVELGTIGREISPSTEDYCKAVDFLSRKIMEKQYNGISNITQAFRVKYYELAKKILKEKRQVLPCYAGFISGQIAPNGDVWACCIKAESMGNLRNANYNLDKIWFSNQAKKIRKAIRDKKCFCPLANASYTNMLVSYRTMSGILKDITAKKVKNIWKKSKDSSG